MKTLLQKIKHHYLTFIRQAQLDRPCRCVPLPRSMEEMNRQEGREEPKA